MGNFFTSLFSSNKGEENNKEKIEQKNFDILKYDGVRAQKIGKHAYAIKCFNEALNLQEDFETLGFLVTSYTVTNQGIPRHLLHRHQPIGGGAGGRQPYGRDKSRQHGSPTHTNPTPVHARPRQRGYRRLPTHHTS